MSFSGRIEEQTYSAGRRCVDDGGYHCGLFGCVGEDSRITDKRFDFGLGGQYLKRLFLLRKSLFCFVISNPFPIFAKNNQTK